MNFGISEVYVVLDEGYKLVTDIRKAIKFTNEEWKIIIMNQNQ